MYKNIEEIYKKKSPYNIIKKRIFWIYALFVSISLIFKFFNKIVLMILTLIVMTLAIKLVSERVLNIKLYFNLGKRKNNDISLPLIIKNTENKLFKDYSVENNLYNEKSLLCIIEHYRNLIKTKVVSGNLLAILSIIVPVLLSFYTKDGFDLNRLASALPYIVFFAIIIILLYFSYSQLIEMKKFLKGEDSMIERLEEIFSEIYIECINTNYTDKKSKSKVKKKNVSKK